MTIAAAQDAFGRSRAGDCCDYRLLPENSGTITFHVDHIRPIKHNGSDDNETCVCPVINSTATWADNISGYDPETDKLTPLYHPRRHSWDEPLKLEADYTITGLTPEGCTTLYVLKINKEIRVQRCQFLTELGMYPC